MKEKAKSVYILDSSEKKSQYFKTFTANTLLRIKRLTLKKLVCHLINFIYKNATLLVIFKKLDQPPVIQIPYLPIECRLLNIKNTDQISSLNNLTVERITAFFTNGAKCLGAFYNEQLVGYLWCHYKDHEFPFFDYSVKVDNGVYIGPNFVADKVRGNKIHRFLLTKMFEILFKEGYRHVWSSVLSNNYSSIKGLVNTGFAFKKKIRVIRIFKKIVHKDCKLF